MKPISWMWVVAAVAGCSERPPAEWWMDAPIHASSAPKSPALPEDVQVSPMPSGLRAARRAGPPEPGPALSLDLLSELGSPISGAVMDDAYGGALVAALEDEPPADVAEFGAGSLTISELFGGIANPVGLCELPHVTWSFEDQGTRWEASAWLGSWYHLMGGPETLFMVPSEACLAGLGAGVAAAVAGDACTADEEHGFFPAGSDCRACVDGGGAFEDCVQSGACDDEVPLTSQYQGDWYEWAVVDVMACAPDVHAKTYLAAVDLPDDGTVPAPWDHSAWALACLAVRESSDGDMGMACIPEDEPSDFFYRNAVAQGVFTDTDWLREEGTDELRHVSRQMFAPYIDLADGRRIDGTLIDYWNLGHISMPEVIGDGNGDGVLDQDDWGVASVEGGYGLTPNLLRPGGTDPNDIDDLWARDWLATITLKTATTRNGVPINLINHTRCDEWVGPHADGSWTCTTPGRPNFPWLEDTHVYFYGSDTQVMAAAMMTLGSTGLPDPLVPGGFVTHIAGTASLANPDWDGCAWPNQFVPDHIRTEDEPNVWGGPASLDADTYKFGKDPDQDLRVVLATPQERGYCAD